jgi:antirestriction protein ArdC
LRNLQGDKKYIIDAASKAQKAVDFILNVTLEESEN